MNNFEEIDGFDWDGGNIEKSLIKHGISCQEAEEIYLDISAIHLEDKKHSIKEKRFAIIGKNFSGKILIAVFTFRKNKIRIISVRDVNKKEKDLYLG
jgi:uncharacterized protein